MNILSQLKYFNTNKLLDNLSYQDHITEYPVPDIIDFNWKNILKNPTKNSSQQTYSELIEVENKSKNRDKNTKDLIYDIDKNANMILYNFLDKMNIKFPIEEFDELYRIIKPVLKNVKNYFNRPRPYQLAKFYNVNIDVLLTDTHHTPSYPSGHTLYTKLACSIIEDDYPKLKNELDKIVQITANCRVSQGVHYRSDNAASLILTNVLHSKIKEKIYG